MNGLQNDFLKRSVAAIGYLVERAKNEVVLPPAFIRDAFRTLHTIKGTSQTFGFSASAEIAHELENQLADAKENDDFLSPNFKTDLLEGFAQLIISFTQTDNADNQKSYIGKKKRTNKTDVKLKNPTNFEAGIFIQFSEHEKKSITAEVNNGKNIFLVNADFGLAEFPEGFKNLREKLSASSEIIATFPNPKTAEKGKIGFQICVASNETIEKLHNDLKHFSIEIIEQELLFKTDLDEILSQIKAHGNDLAKKTGKDIEIKLSAERLKISSEKSKLIFEILLHLLRNAIDHAIETEAERITKGKNHQAEIKIAIISAKDGLKLSVKDDGKGIDTEKIRRKAIENKLISSGKKMTEGEMLDLIFVHEFSTAETVTEVSGRGIGLDAVKNLVENANGTISVKTRRDFGTTFEVFLCHEK